jgi:hypothetical protein
MNENGAQEVQDDFELIPLRMVLLCIQWMRV